MTNWRALEQKVDQTTARAYSEMVRLTPMKNGVTDTTRPQTLFKAILHVGGDDSYSAGTGMRVRLVGGQGELIIDRSTYTGPTPIAKDVVRSMDRAGQPSFEVAKISDRYSNLIVLSLNAR